MRKSFLLLLLVALLISTKASAEVSSYQPKISKSEVNFNVDSTLHLVHGHTSTIVSEVIFDEITGRVTLPMEVEIPVRSLDTQNEKRDKAMRKMFDAENHPVIKWQAESINCEASSTVDMLCHAKGKLKIRDIQKEASFDVLLKKLEGRIAAEGKWSLNRKDFKLEAPSVLGIIKVADQVDLDFNIEWILKS